MKQFFFLSGLPRSGSTVLASILSQNPSLYASPNSALVELLVNVRNHLRITEQARAFMQPTQERDVLLAIMEGMYQFTDKPIVIDKSRAWPHPDNIRLLIDILPEKPKFIATVRDLPAVLTSFITLIDNDPERNSFIDKQLSERNLALTNENRCEMLFSAGGTVHEAWYSLKMAFDAGFGELFHIVEYDDLTSKPHQTLKNIYKFLGVPVYDHDLKNIQNETPEDDSVYGVSGMHEIRRTLSKMSKDPKKVLGENLCERYENVPHFWREPTKVEDATIFNPFKLKSLN